MKIILKNEMLVASINFLQSIKLKGKASRARTKLVNLITESVSQLSESELALMKEYGELDDQGEPIKLENGNYKIKKATNSEFQKEHAALLREDAEISGPTYADHLKDCLDFLDNYDGELSGTDAQAYDVLLDAMEAESDGDK